MPKGYPKHKDSSKTESRFPKRPTPEYHQDLRGSQVVYVVDKTSRRKDNVTE